MPGPPDHRQRVVTLLGPAAGRMEEDCGRPQKIPDADDAEVVN